MSVTSITTTWTTTGSPIGELTLVAADGRLAGVYFPRHWYRPDPATVGRFAETGFEEVKRQLAEYFAGDRERSISRSTSGGTNSSAASGTWSAPSRTARPRPTATWPASWAARCWPRTSARRWDATR